MLYTSGTTARPKGVPRRQRAERAARWRMWRKISMAVASVRSASCALSHHGVRSLLAMSLLGGVFVCMRRFDAENALRLIGTERVTNLYLVPRSITIWCITRASRKRREFRAQARLCRAPMTTSP